MKKDIKAWAIKIKNRNFYQNAEGIPVLYRTKADATGSALRVEAWESIKAQPIRVRVRIEELE